MCNPAFNDGVRERVSKLIAHTDDLRTKYTDLENGFRLGDLDDGTLESLNQVVHLLETDAAEFEMLIEKHG